MFTRVGCFLFAVDHTYTQIQVYKSTSLISNLANISVVLKQILLSFFFFIFVPSWHCLNNLPMVLIDGILTANPFSFIFYFFGLDCVLAVLLINSEFLFLSPWWDVASAGDRQKSTVLTNSCIYQGMTSDLHIIINPRHDPSRSLCSHLTKGKGQLAQGCVYPLWPQNVCPSIPPSLLEIW